MIAAPTAPNIQANIAPPAPAQVEQIAPAPVEFSAPDPAPVVTRNEPPAKTKKPKTKTAKKPPSPPGYFFRQHGAGWDLRRDTYVTSHDGERKRRQPFVAHMSAETYRELKRQHRGAALERAVFDWISSHNKRGE